MWSSRLSEGELIPGLFPSLQQLWWSMPLLASHLYLCLHMALSCVAECLKSPLLSFLFSSFS